MEINWEELPLVEDEPIRDLFASGIARIEPLGGGCFRFVIYSLQFPTNGGSPERVVVAKIVAARPSIIDAVQQMMTTLGMDILDKVASIIPH